MPGQEPRIVYNAALLNEPEFGPIEDDDSIFLPMDHIASSQPWLLAEYNEHGPFSDDAIDELASKHSFPERPLRRFSSQIGHCLDPGAPINLVKVSRSKAARDAKEAAKRAMRAAKRGDVKQAMDEIKVLSDHFPPDEPVSTALIDAKQAASHGTPDVAALLSALKAIVHSPNMAFKIAPLDWRKAKDNRRMLMSWSACYLFIEQGRPVRYQSTDDGQPGGPLIEFTLDFMRRLTTKGTAPSPRTVRDDIDLFRDPDLRVYPIDKARVNKSKAKLTIQMP